METVDDILREMCEDIEKGNVPLWADFGCEIARDYVARIKAAWRDQLAEEKTIAAAKGYAQGKQSVPYCNQVNMLESIGEVIRKTRGCCSVSITCGNCGKCENVYIVPQSLITKFESGIPQGAYS